MKVTSNLDTKKFEQKTQRFIKRYFEISISEYSRLGRERVTDARNKSKEMGSFDDKTGNLRSSIGFILFYDSVEVGKEFPGKLVFGKQAGISSAHEAVLDYPKGWAIVIVAGMSYASHVEAKNFDVITGSTLGMSAKFANAQKRIKTLLQKEFS
ncbi:MAG TPA: hypothetical protein VNI52_03080 [Sphingobacteriaceae bacterium]|nr:hypothetical protein [Sphingobacteriaceae bacterium]